MDNTSFLNWLESTIQNVEAQADKFKEGSSQATLIKNRLFALRTSLSLLDNEDGVEVDLIQALEPMKSILRKNMKAQEKHSKETTIYNRLQKNIECARFCFNLIEEKL